jgi:predicted acyltransferase
VPWHGWTPTDLVFPFFLFIVGVALTFSKRASFRDALVRALKLIGLGLLLALYPYFPFLELRWPGVLQRIGVCYLAAWAARRFLAPRGQAALAAILLVGYWALMTKVTGPEGLPPQPREADQPRGAGGSDADQRPHVGGHEDLGPGGPRLDAAGDRDPALGLLCGAWLAGRGARTPFRTTLGLVGGGLVLTVLGLLWGKAAPPGLLFPINKNLWSPSFVLFTGGLASACLGVAYAVVDVSGWRRWAAPLVTYGRNPIAVYVAAGILEDTPQRDQVARGARHRAEPPPRGSITCSPASAACLRTRHRSPGR